MIWTTAKKSLSYSICHKKWKCRNSLSTAADIKIYVTIFAIYLFPFLYPIFCIFSPLCLQGKSPPPSPVPMWAYAFETERFGLGSHKTLTFMTIYGYVLRHRSINFPYFFFTKKCTQRKQNWHLLDFLRTSKLSKQQIFPYCSLRYWKYNCFTLYTLFSKRNTSLDNSIRDQITFRGIDNIIFVLSAYLTILCCENSNVIIR
jgi:hypothetical protein